MELRIDVIGSINCDMVTAVKTLPLAGETVLGGPVSRLPGGKGANQSVALARLGARTFLHGSVGDDEYGRWSIEHLASERVGTSTISIAREPTGMALIVVDEHGENMIVVSLGANALTTAPLPDLSGTDAVLVQLEVPFPWIERALSGFDGLLVLNASPATPLPPAFLRRPSVIIVNETELDALGDLSNMANVVLTKGSSGAELIEYGRTTASVEAMPIDVIDTVGAGDSFAAALTFDIARGSDPHEALRFATAAGALATTESGAQSALPNLADVERFLSGRDV